ncbi:MAG: flavodoxin [Clostridia bacterium]|nr:flavodoxin [Clostridia bacterium]
MNIAVRYYSRSGNTKALADAIAKAVGEPAVSVEAPEAPLTAPVDVLFIGGALYAYGLDRHLKDYLQTLKKESVKRAVVFSTSWLSKHSLDLIKKELSARGIPVEDGTFYAKNRPSPDELRAAADFAKKYL